MKKRDLYRAWARWLNDTKEYPGGYVLWAVVECAEYDGFAAGIE